MCRKIILFIVSVLIVFGLVGCGAQNDAIDNETTETTEVTEAPTEPPICPEASVCQGTWIECAALNSPTHSYMYIEGEQVTFCYEDTVINEVTGTFFNNGTSIILNTGESWFMAITDTNTDTLWFFEGDSQSDVERKVANGYSPLAYKRVTEEIVDVHFDQEPYIGMPVWELEMSSWGDPEDINRTTTKYGVSEQWVYSGYRFVYVEDGVVTTIQE